MRRSHPGAIHLGTHGLLNWRHLTLKPSEAKTHQHVIGISGSGKSRYLAALFISYIRQDSEQRSLTHTAIWPSLSSTC